MITALPILNILETKYPNSYKIWFIQKKCQHAAPLFINHPLIDKIIIGKLDDGLTREETQFKYSCDIVIDESPLVVDNEKWYNLRNHVDESILMAGFNPMECPDRVPSLTRWFDKDKNPRTVALWAFAGYGEASLRNPSIDWWGKACDILIRLGFKVVQLGLDSDPPIHTNIKRLKKMSFFEQIKFSLSCEFVIGTDSGSQWVLGAYGVPQIIVFTNWANNHWTNLDAFCPINKDNLQIKLFAFKSIDHITHQRFEEAVRLLSYKCTSFI